MVAQRRAGVLWMLTRPGAALAAGVVIWSCRCSRRRAAWPAICGALSAQAGEDFAWVDMVWANPTPRRLALSLYETFVMPWSAIPLAVAVAVAALIGLALSLQSERRGLLILLAGLAGTPPSTSCCRKR